MPKEVENEKKHFIHIVSLCIYFYPRFVHGCGRGAAS